MSENGAVRSPSSGRTRGRLVVFGALLFLAVLVALGGWWYLGPLPMGEGPAGPPVPREPFETVWREEPVWLVGLGDSMTAGFGASPGLSYFDRLIANPTDEFEDMRGINLSRVFPRMEATNLAVSGSNSIECLRDQVPLLEAAPESTFGVVVMTTGGNDLIHWYGRTPPREGAMYGATMEEATPWIARYEERLDTILEEVRNRFPGGCHIFLANIYDPSDGVGRPSAAGLPPWKDVLEILTAYNDIIARAAGRHDHVTLVDIHTAFLGHGVHCRDFWRRHYRSEDPHYWYYENIEDPNDRGYDAIRRLFLIAMADVFHENHAAAP